MEHVANPNSVLQSMTSILKREGLAFIGISPFFKSPYGAHMRKYIKLPWFHLLFKEATVLKWLKRKHGFNSEYRSFIDIPGSGANKMGYYNYISLIQKSNMHIISLKRNQCGKCRKLESIMELFATIMPFRQLKEFFIVDCYAVLQKGKTIHN